MVGGLLRLAFAVLAVLGLAAGAVELGLRAGGARPRAAPELSIVVPDGWTGFRLRPGVSGQEAFVTNDLGMHAPRSYALARPPGVLRAAVLGSSVVYGLATPFADTIPGVVERELQAAGHRAEVLNFGTHAFTIVHVSALLQAYVHQLQPDAVVVVIDLQVGLPRWPDVRPGAASAEEGIETLEQTIRESGIVNLRPIVADIAERLPFEDASVDFCLLGTVLHDLSAADQSAALAEVARVLRPGGVLALVEFKKVDQGPGPPKCIRISEPEAEAMIGEFGFLKTYCGDLGEFTYLLIARKK